MRIPENIDPFYYDPEVHAEHRLVDYTLRKLHRLYKRPKLAKKQKPDEFFSVFNAQKDLGESGRMTLDAMHEVVSLPIRLYRGNFSSSTTTVQPNGTVKIAGGGTVPDQVGKLIVRFQKSAIGKAFRQIQIAHRASHDLRPVGMLFPFDHVPGGMILHSGQFNTPLPTIITTGSGHVRLERYEHVLKAIVAGDRGLGTGPTATAERDIAAITAVVRKSMRHTTAARLVHYFAAHLLGRPTSDNQQHMQLHGGVPWVVMTVPQLAAAVDASARTVQAAIEKLRTQGVLQVQRGGFDGDGCRNGYRLDIDLLMTIDDADQEDER